MADEEDRILGFADQFGGFVDPVDVRALIDQAITLRHQRRWQVQLFQNDVAGIFDVNRTRRAAHRLANAFTDHFVGLIGIFDRSGIFHRIFEQRHLLHELDAAPADALFGDAGALARQEDDGRMFDQRALDRGRHIGDARPQRADSDGGLACDARGSFGHEACGGFMMGRNHGPAAPFGLQEHMDEVRIGDAEQGVDAFGLEQVEDTLIDWRAWLVRCGCSGGRLGIVVAHFNSLGAPVPMYAARLRWKLVILRS